MSELSAQFPTVRNEPPIRWWEVLLGLVGGLVLLFALLLAINIVSGSAGHPEFLDGLSGSHFALAITAAGLSNALVLLIFAFLWQSRPQNLVTRFFPPVPNRFLWAAGVCGVVLVGMFEALHMLVEMLSNFRFEPLRGMQALTPRTPLQFLGAVAIGVLLGPFVEEFVFRGLLLSWLRRLMPVAGAVVLGSLVFAAFHFYFFGNGVTGLVVTAEIVLLGIIFSICAMRTGSLRTSFALHAGYNLATFVAMMVLS